MTARFPSIGRAALAPAICGLGILAAGASGVGASPFGINAHVPASVVIDEIDAAGIGWVRIDVVWARVETTPDHFDWQIYDRLLDRLEARGLRVYATLQGTPAWATAGTELSGVPLDRRDWQEFVYRAAARYRGRVAAWGLWNEPNLRHFWEGTRRDYIDVILVPGARAVHAADPEALVCGPDLAHLSSADWDRWLRQVIDEAGELLDVVTHHHYPGDGTASDLLEALDDLPPWMQDEPTVREVLQDSGWWGRPFWLTETGVESGRVGWSAQARYYEDVVADWFGPQPAARWTERVFFYQIHDPPAPDTSTFGILGAWPELERKFAFTAYGDAIDATVFDDGEVLAVRAPRFVAPGATADIVIEVHNTGRTTWSGAEGYRLEVRSDGIAWTVLEHLLPTAFAVEPGDRAVTAVRIRAPWIVPAEQRDVTLRVRMKAPDGRRFGDPVAAVITATPELPPTLHSHPSSLIVREGAGAGLAVEVTSASSVSYQWRRHSVELEDGERVAGSRTPELRLSGVDASLAGSYDCVISNAAGSITSAAAELSLGTPPPRSATTRSRPAPPSGLGIAP